MAEMNPHGDYFINNFYKQFVFDDYHIQASFESIGLINSILEEATNNSEQSEFTRSMALYLGLADYVKDFDIYYDEIKVVDGRINQIPILCHYEVTDQRIIDFVTEKRLFLYNLLQYPEKEVKSDHLRRPTSVSVHSLNIEYERLCVDFQFSMTVEHNEDYFIEQLGQHCIRYKLNKFHDGRSQFNIQKKFYQEFK